MKMKRREVQLPTNRIKTIMKSSPDVESISQDALYVVTKCTELFIQYMAVKGFEKCQNNILEYKGIATFTQNKPQLNFLTEILPQKLTVRQCKEIIMRDEGNSGDSSTDEETSFEDKQAVENGS